MQLKLDPRKDLFSLFPTRIGMVNVPNAVSINPALESMILKRQDGEPGVSHSNIGGWQSTADLADWPEQEAKDLVDTFRNAVINMITLTTEIDSENIEMYVGAWANVNRKGNFNQVHTHPENTWSAVYYVTAGDYANDTIKKPGQIHLLDPRERIDMLAHPSSSFGQPFPLSPVAGLMLLFPSWLGHNVNVFYSDTVRISIALNAQILRVNPN
jgi:uncharacterized protein (TIGR02466 family)